jgi:hypothetical protein
VRTPPLELRPVSDQAGTEPAPDGGRLLRVLNGVREVQGDDPAAMGLKPPSTEYSVKPFAFACGLSGYARFAVAKVSQETS